MKKRIALGLSWALISLLLTSCSDYSSGERFLSLEELESTHLKMELTDGVLVDAVITPYNRYQNGLSAYYVSWMPQGTNLVPKEAFVAEPSIYGYSVEKLAQLLAGQSGFLPEYTWDTFSAPGELRGYLTMQDRSGVKRTLLCSWYVDKEGRVDSASSGFYYNYEWDAFDHNAACNLLSVAVPDDSELAFASSKELVVWAKAILETLTGEDYYSEVTCVPIGEVNRQQLKDRGFELERDLSISSSPYLEEDYYGYLFYQKLDGFPLKYLCPSITLTENVTWGEELDAQHYQDFLIPLMADKQFVSWGGDSGLRSLYANRKIHVQEVYKEQEPVCDINVILENARQYFDSMLITNTMTVNHIEIAYSYWFSDAEDGPLRNIAAPFWTVQYWNPSTEFQMLLVYDAFTGRFVGEKMYTP